MKDILKMLRIQHYIKNILVKTNIRKKSEIL